MLSAHGSRSSYCSGFCNVDSSAGSQGLPAEDASRNTEDKVSNASELGRDVHSMKVMSASVAHRHPEKPENDTPSNVGPDERITDSRERWAPKREQLLENPSVHSDEGTNESHVSYASADRFETQIDTLGDYELRDAADGTASTMNMMHGILPKPRLSKSKVHSLPDRRRHGQELKASDLEKCTALKLITLREIFKNAGKGNIVTAWRRYVDFNGDGFVYFAEFCKALATMNYQGDALELWLAVDADMSNSLALDELDHNAAEVLIFFKQWIKRFGGPAEFFDLVDIDKNGSLSREELGYGIEGFGWFHDPGCPTNCDTVEDVLDVLFPALDLDGLGSITANELLFLETDSKKKKMLARKYERERAKKEGAAVERPQSRKHATRFLQMLVRNSTTLGNVHWTQFKDFRCSPARDIMDATNPVAANEKLSKIRKSQLRLSKPPMWVPSLVQELDRCDLHTANGTRRDVRNGIREAIGKISEAEQELWMIRARTEMFEHPQQQQLEPLPPVDNTDAPMQWRPHHRPSVTKVSATPEKRAAGKARELLRLTYHRVIRRLVEGRTAVLPATFMQRQKKTRLTMRTCYTRPPIVLPKVVAPHIRRARRRAIALSCMADLRRPEELFLYYYNEKMAHEKQKV